MDLVVWTGVAWLGGLALGPSLAVPAFVGVASIGVCLALARWRAVWLVPAGLWLGLLTHRSLPDGPVLRGPSAVQGMVAAAPMGRSADLAVWACADAGSGFRPCSGRVRVMFDEPPAPGSSWVVAGEASAPRSPGIGGGPDPARSAALARVRTVLRARSQSLLGGDVRPVPAASGSRAMLDAVAVNDRRGIDPETWEILRDTGTSHLLSISGFHVGVVAGAVGGLVAFGLRRVAWVRPEGVPLAWAWWAGAMAAVAYTGLAGAPISAQRAAGVAVLAAVGRSFGRGIEPLRLLAMAAVGVCVVDPAAIATPSFQLSFGAMVGLIRFGAVLDGPVASRTPWGLGWAGRGTVATVSATLGTLPAAAWWFQSLSVSSPVANLIAIPWFTFAVVPASVVATWGPEPLAGLAGALGTRAVDVLLVVLAGLRTAPLAPAVGPLGALGMCAIFLRPRAGFTAAILLLALGLRTRSAGGMEVTFFDVGQGDAALVEFADGRRWLVDGGRGEEVLKALRRRGIRSLDAVIASHADADHADGLLPVVRQLRVGTLQIGSGEGHETLVQAAHDRGVPVVIRPTLRGPGISDNDGSVVVRASSPWGSVLFAGDLEAAGEAVHGAPSTVLKVPHHGAATSSSELFLARVRPLLGVVPVGPNRYGHPDPGVEARFRESGIPLLRTDLDGEITVRFDPEGIVVHSATGPTMRLDGNRRARIPNTPTASAASPMLKPWL